MISTAPLRHALRIKGTVQGVGFRPTVYRLASRCGLGGLVRNDSGGVWVEVEGEANVVERFPELLRAEAPPLARIDSIEVLTLALQRQAQFIVEPSEERAGRAVIPADSATCEACLAELFDPTNRRYRYPFINCTDCGPRYSIVRDLPYDRERTTMSAFALCAACRGEYLDPGNRRFHAEPNACASCGPKVQLIAPGRRARHGEEAISAAISRLACGEILAVKGLGGFFLAADARDEAAVAMLRARKHRRYKPFALMVKDLEEADRLCELDAVSTGLLRGPARPIVLMRARPRNRIAQAVAPGLGELGVMLPYTPLHHLLLNGPISSLVMTSGNLSEEPIARDNEEALARLSGVADAFLVHDREIHSRVDDSVLRVNAGKPQPVRRARGYVPAPLSLGFEAPPVLAVGAELKSTICVTRGDEAFLSPHLGDLQDARTHGYFVEAIEKLQRLLGTKPAVVAHDLHPDYLSTRWARASGLRTFAVQHHHAHVASCLAEHRRTDQVIGVVFDGTGCGPKGDLWGGEILLADLKGFRRLGHLRPIALPGGAAAIREPWRLACSALVDAEEPLDCLGRIDPQRLGVIQQLAQKKFTPRATGAGRWFDAISALCGIRDEISYEGQAAVELEACAADKEVEPFPLEVESNGVEHPFCIDLRPTVRSVAAELRRGALVADISARFHETLSRAVVSSCLIAREEQRVSTVAFSGGCFQNRRLTERTKVLLEREGFEVLVHREVPPNDGGLSLGQAAVAAHHLREEAALVPGNSR